jgi:hypothetical protein
MFVIVVSITSTVSAGRHPQQGSSIPAPTVRSSRAINLRTITGRTVTFDFQGQGGSLAALGVQQLERIRGISGFNGELTALVAQLDAGDDLVSAETCRLHRRSKIRWMRLLRGSLFGRSAVRAYQARAPAGNC